MATAEEVDLPEPRTTPRVGMVLLEDGGARYSTLLAWVFTPIMAACLFASLPIGTVLLLANVAVAIYGQRFGTTVARDGLTVRKITGTTTYRWDEIDEVVYRARDLLLTLRLPGRQKLWNLPYAVPNVMDAWAHMEAFKKAAPGQN